MARAPLVEPDGLVYRAELLTLEEESELLTILGGLRFEPIVLHGQEARRTVRRFGVGYDYESRTPAPGDDFPGWLLSLRAKAAELAEHEPEELVAGLVQRYPPGSTIGWHRDAPAFGIVVGVSLGGDARLRFQRGKREARRVWEVALEARSGYVLAGEARWSWEHSIPPTKELRYSVTFRTLRSST